MVLARGIIVATWLHVKIASRGTGDLIAGVVVPIVQATLAIYLFRLSGDPSRLLQVAVGAGLMGIWSTVLFGSGRAIQVQRWLGTLELILVSPSRPVRAILPITLATSLTGLNAMVGTLVWTRLVFGVQWTFPDPLLFVAAIVACLAALGVFGLLIASAFVFLPNANALSNTLEYPIWLVSGMLVPIAALPDWAKWVARLLPTSWASTAVHDSVQGSGSTLDAIALCLVAIVVYGAAARVLLDVVERRARVTAALAVS
jgi:ABC-2 type transport system permease protein